MDNNTVQYQERTESFSDWEILEIMLTMMDESTVSYEDFKLAQDFVKMNQSLYHHYSVKRQYEDNHYLWIKALAAEQKIKEIQEQIAVFRETNKDCLKKMVSIGTAILDTYQRCESKVLVCEMKKQNRYPKENKLEQRESLIKELDRMLITIDNYALSYFDNLIRTTFLFCTSQLNDKKSAFLFNDELSFVDAIVFTMFVNGRELMSDVQCYDVAQKIEKVYYQNNVNLINTLTPFSKETIDKLYKNRIELYERLYTNNNESGPSKYNSVIANFKFILLLDKLEGKYEPFYENSALRSVSMFDMKKCEDEIYEYLSQFLQLFGRDLSNAQHHMRIAQKMWNTYDLELDADLEDLRKPTKISSPGNSKMFNSMVASIKQGLNSYCERKCKAVLFAFNEALMQTLVSFSEGGYGEDFDFSISCKNEDYIEYVDFHFEENLVEVTSGGMCINKEYGSDSYTNWKYSVWRNGEEQIENAAEDSFDAIKFIFNSQNVNFSISTPDEFEYDSETPSGLIDALTEQLNLFDLVDETDESKE